MSKLPPMATDAVHPQYRRYQYGATISDFINSSSESILGELTKGSSFDVDITQRNAWMVEIEILQTQLSNLDGSVYFEFVIPRMGKRADVILVVRSCIFVIEFKVGSSVFDQYAIDQAEDYALDLANFHSESHNKTLIPVLIATDARLSRSFLTDEGLCTPKCVKPSDLSNLIEDCISRSEQMEIKSEEWEVGRYSPTPTIIEAARALFEGQRVEEITRSDSGATNLKVTAQTVAEIIKSSQEERVKSICFVTGVPGAGKTLVGLQVTSSHNEVLSGLQTVFLSGNKPLVDVLHEALARDKVEREKKAGLRYLKKTAAREVKTIVQIVHHYRDQCIRDSGPPPEHVAIFDESQRAWDLAQTASFMKQKKGLPDFNKSEPEFLISCLDRHKDWACIVCLVGGGQEINRGEAGIRLWLDSIREKFPEWRVFISPQLKSAEFGITDFDLLASSQNIHLKDELHLGVSMRSFRSEQVSNLIGALLDLERKQAKALVETVLSTYPIVVTRNLAEARKWLRSKARGTERYGLMASSSAERLRPVGIHVKSKASPIHYFLGGKEDVRSSFYLEESASEFEVQGLELDWGCVTWDGDLRLQNGRWQHWSFKGSKWQRIKVQETQRYQKNAYRVLLTRARQGMVICVPEGDPDDHTRPPGIYDETFNYLRDLGFPVI